MVVWNNLPRRSTVTQPNAKVRHVETLDVSRTTLRIIFSISKYGGNLTNHEESNLVATCMGKAISIQLSNHLQWAHAFIKHVAPTIRIFLMCQSQSRRTVPITHPECLRDIKACHLSPHLRLIRKPWVRGTYLISPTTNAFILARRRACLDSIYICQCNRDITCFQHDMSYHWEDLRWRLWLLLWHVRV